MPTAIFNIGRHIGPQYRATLKPHDTIMPWLWHYDEGFQGGHYFGHYDAERHQPPSRPTLQNCCKILTQETVHHHHRKEYGIYYIYIYN